MRVALGAFRTMGLPFNAAWTRALNTLPRDDPDRAADLAILGWARGAYQAAYENGDYEVIARPAGDWDAEPDVDATILAFVGAAVGASDGDDPVAVRSIADPPESPSAAGRAPDGANSGADQPAAPDPAPTSR